MPEYALLGRSSRARAWLAEVWDPAAAPSSSPPLNPAALAGAVALDRVVRFPAPTAAASDLPAAPGGSAEDPDTYLPSDEADGTGLGPVLADTTVMIIPVEAPPLRRAWTATAGWGAALGGGGGPTGEASSPVNAFLEAVGGTDDEDDEVVTVRMVCDVQRDLIGAATGGLVSLQPVTRGVLHRRTGETLSLTTVPAPPGVPASRLLMLEYCTPGPFGSATNFLTTLAVGGNGPLTLLSRVSGVMQPTADRPTLVFPPADGVTATAGFSRDIQGTFGVAFAPCVPGATAVSAPSAGSDSSTGSFPALLPLVMHCTEASAATTARMRCRAVAALLPPPGPLRMPSSGVPATSTTVSPAATVDTPAGVRRPRRPRRNLGAVESEAERRRIMRNRASAARSNAARRRERLAARLRDGAAAAAGGGRPLRPPPPARLPVLLPRL